MAKHKDTSGCCRVAGREPKEPAPHPLQEPYRQTATPGGQGNQQGLGLSLNPKRVQSSAAQPTEQTQDSASMFPGSSSPLHRRCAGRRLRKLSRSHLRGTREPKQCRTHYWVEVHQTLAVAASQHQTCTSSTGRQGHSPNDHAFCSPCNEQPGACLAAPGHTTHDTEHVAGRHRQRTSSRLRARTRHLLQQALENRPAI